MALTHSSPSDTRRLLIVDDHPIVRKGLSELFASERDLQIGGEASDVEGALELLRAKSFDLVLIDICLRGVSGLDLLKELKIHWPRLPALVLSMHDEMLYAERALRAGARGYLMKEEAPEHIVTAIRGVLDGHIYVSAAANARMLSKLLDGNRSQGDGSVIDRLSNRELEVFQFIGRGNGTRSIASEMHVSVKTIETYRAHIKEKLKLRTAPELMRFAVEWVSQQKAS